MLKKNRKAQLCEFQSSHLFHIIALISYMMLVCKSNQMIFNPQSHHNAEIRSVRWSDASRGQCVRRDCRR